jgi:hypothetical protein
VASTLLTGTIITVKLYRLSAPTAATPGTMTLVATYNFTYAAGSNVPATRTVGLGANDTAAIANLAALINDPVYGVLDPLTAKLVVVATASTVNLTVTAQDDNLCFGLSSTPDDGTNVKSFIGGSLLVEVDKAAMNLAGGFTWIAARVTTASATVICDVTLARIGRFSAQPQQAEQLTWL